MTSSLLLERLDLLRHAGPVTPFAQDEETRVAVTLLMLASVESLMIMPEAVAIMDAVVCMGVCFALPQPTKIPHAHLPRYLRDLALPFLTESGTGRYENATGTVSIKVDINLALRTAKGTFDGTISVPSGN